MKLEFGYGNGIQTVEVPDANLAEVLMSNPIEHKRHGRRAVEYALANPIGSPALSEIVKERILCRADGGRPRIVIVTSDISRPMPTYEVLPSVLDEIYKGGGKPEDVTVVIARGSHRSSTEAELRHLVGSRCYEEIRVIDSDYEDCVHFGETSRGTPVDYDRIVSKADIRIALGNIEFHYFAGYSGGYKAIMPGVSTPAAIQANHRMMVEAAACAGRLDDNPLRQDIEEAGAMIGVDFILNVVLDEHKRIVYAVAGDVVKAHRDGCRYLDAMYRKTVSEPADIIIVSQGGAPKDINLYQTQKALDNSKHIIKDGGTIILVGACSEGLGNPTFEKWLTEAKSPRELVDRIHADFRLGGHKAAAIAMVLERADIYLISEMEPDFVRSIFFKPAASVQEAFDAAMKKHGPGARVIAMPYGGSVLPALSPHD